MRHASHTVLLLPASSSGLTRAHARSVTAVPSPEKSTTLCSRSATVARPSASLEADRGETDHDGVPGLTLRLAGDVGEISPPAVEEALS